LERRAEQEEEGRMSQRTLREQFFIFIVMMAIAFAYVHSLFTTIQTTPAFASLSFGLMASVFIVAAFLIFAKQC
jgi:uncharacterized membrane protein YhaH (DUF805 family)